MTTRGHVEMTVFGSICLALIRRLERILDHPSKQAVETLSRRQVHSHSYIDARFWRGAGINDGLQKRQIDYSVKLSGLADQIDKFDRCVVLRDEPGFRSKFYRFLAFVFSHRVSLLFICGDGQAYDLSGQKWSRS